MIFAWMGPSAISPAARRSLFFTPWISARRRWPDAAPGQSTESAWADLLACGAQLRLPDFLQLDNDVHRLGRPPHVFGRFVRLALYLASSRSSFRRVSRSASTGRKMHGTWPQASGREPFASARAPGARGRGSSSGIRPMPLPALGGVTVSKPPLRLRGRKLLRRQIAQIPAELPLTAGRRHFLRKVDAQGRISILKEHWHAAKTLSGHSSGPRSIPAKPPSSSTIAPVSVRTPG